MEGIDARERAMRRIIRVESEVEMERGGVRDSEIFGLWTCESGEHSG